MNGQFDLSRIGANAELLLAFGAFAARGLELARVSAVYRDQYRAFTASGEVKAEAIGALLYRLERRSEWPAVGDWVAVQRTGPDEAMIHAVLPRKTVFSRRAPGEREEEQVLAANVDVALIICGLDHDFSVRRIERYVTMIRESGAEAAVVLNKADLAADISGAIAEVHRAAAGSPVIAMSALRPEAIDPIVKIASGTRTVAMLGSSGVGKSTLINALLGEARQAVCEVRATDSKGRHTTTVRELLPLPGGGAVIDTPGMRELQLWADPGSLDMVFEDLSAWACLCKFRDCSHVKEKGCAVLEAVERGDLEEARYHSFLKLRAELAWHERKSDVVASLALKQRWKAIHKGARGAKPRFPGA